MTSAIETMELTKMCASPYPTCPILSEVTARGRSGSGSGLNGGG